jgi:hypothetical protein
MREVTNLSWTDTPFGGVRRPFADRTPLLAAFSISATDHAPAAAAAVYLPLPRGRSLIVTDAMVRFGFHAVAAETPADSAAVAASVDAWLVQARRQAAILTGHRLAGELAALVAASAWQPARGITAVRAAWSSQPMERGLARLQDTHREPGALADICAGRHLHGLPTALPQAGPDGNRAALQTLRQLVVRALAIALIAARTAGHYQWDLLRLDAVVEAAAWDQLPSPAAIPAG